MKSDFGLKDSPCGMTGCQNPAPMTRMYSLAEVATPVISKVAGTEEKMTADGR